MTTDMVPKTAFAEVPLRRGEVRIAGMTKGSGMIHPKMATTLGFVMTDAAISPHPPSRHAEAGGGAQLQPAFGGRRHLHQRYVVLLANGASGIKPSERERRTMQESLTLVMEDLAMQIAKDGEGATKLITIRVVGATDEDAAVKMARAIANSPLVKTAIGGTDPNWGRILSAVGNSGVDIDPAQDRHLYPGRAGVHRRRRGRL